jgi:hypothetical protein
MTPQKILLIDFDKTQDPKLDIPNLALMQISAYEKAQGNTVQLIKAPHPHFDPWPVDKVYISCIFTKNKERALELVRSNWCGATVSCGGTGFELGYDWLPAAIQDTKPDYDLYPSTYSQGYTTRGCTNRCSYCVVPTKEGDLRICQHPRHFHDERFKTCMIMDNNLFAAPAEWVDHVFYWFIDNKIKMMSPQGWDARLLTPLRTLLLKTVKHVGPIHFAWDRMTDEADVYNAIGMLKNRGFDMRRKISFYVLCGYNTTLEQDIYRCQQLKDLGVQAYAMRYRQTPELNKLARWTARPQLFWKFDFKDYDRSKE